MTNLKEARQAAGLTQQQLADQCHVVRQTICEIERGINRPSVELAKLMGAALGVDWVGFFDE